MPPRRKQPQATKTPSEQVPTPSPSQGSSWKWKVVVFLFGVLVLGAFWVSGAFKDLFAGPKVPLPHGTLDLQLGMTLDQVLEKYPLLNLGDLLKENPGMGLEEILKKHKSLKKKLPKLERQLRSYNGDPEFGITTLDPKNGLSGAASMDLLFFKDRLYFISTLWEEAQAKEQDFPGWIHQFRRWIRSSNASGEKLEGNAVLKEWYLVDPGTEMTLRELLYQDRLQRWQDLRNASDPEAQEAFKKYRLDAAN